MSKREYKKPSYSCIFDEEVYCPVRTQWKLKPESLAPFCKVCSKVYLPKKKLVGEKNIR